MDMQRVTGDFLAARSKIDTIVTAAKGLLCMPSILFTFLQPKNLAKGIGMIAVSVGNAVANTIIDTVQDRIEDLVKVASTPLKLLQSYVKSLKNTLDNVSKILANLDKKSKSLLDFMKGTQNCAVMAANFMNCISTIIANKITKKVLPKINNTFDKLQKDLAAETYRAGGLMEQHAGRQIKQAEKLTRQLSILTS